jgi:hypothetical protein
LTGNIGSRAVCGLVALSRWQLLAGQFQWDLEKGCLTAGDASRQVVFRAGLTVNRTFFNGCYTCTKLKCLHVHSKKNIANRGKSSNNVTNKQQ